MKTAEEIYDSEFIDFGFHSPANAVMKKKIISAMNQYAYQFMNFVICNNCNGSGEVCNTKCIYCNGYKKVILLPTITTTNT